MSDSPTKEESYTPRTDAAAFWVGNPGGRAEIASSTFCRQLERELTEALRALRREENARKVLADENDRLRKDYRRYGFLRSAGPSDRITVETFGHPDGVCHLGGDDLDAAIDAAMGKLS